MQRKEPETQVLVKADSAVAYGRVVQAMVVLQHAGARKIGFITEAAAASKSSQELMRRPNAAPE